MAPLVEEVKGPQWGRGEEDGRSPLGPVPGEGPRGALKKLGVEGVGPAFDSLQDCEPATVLGNFLDRGLLLPLSPQTSIIFPSSRVLLPLSLRKQKSPEGDFHGGRPAATQHSWPYFMPSLWSLGVTCASPLPRPRLPVLRFGRH